IPCLTCFVGFWYRTHITIYTSKSHFVTLLPAMLRTKPEFSCVFKAKVILGYWPSVYWQTEVENGFSGLE
uniref:Uncharacterized protein n=1 Tax=Serinus canaria TaxID=9135 RepID=A0A8C9MU63_SERCA